MNHQKPEEPGQRLFQRVYNNIDRLNFLHHQRPRTACFGSLNWAHTNSAIRDTDHQRPERPLPYLPQEIQDQIFEYAVTATYELGCYKSTSPASTTQSILTTSKRTHGETLKSLYSNSVFRYTITACMDTGIPIEQALTDRMMHVEVVVDCESLKDKRYDQVVKARLRLKQIVDTFGGTDIKRKTLRFHLRYCPYIPDCVLDWFCLQPLSSFQGFDTVRLEHDVLGRNPRVGFNGMPRSGFHDEMIKMVLQPALGPATIGDTEANCPPLYTLHYLEFHPNEYVMKTSIEERELYGREGRERMDDWFATGLHM